MQITDNFTLDEFLKSQTASRRGYSIVADLWTQQQIVRLVETCLQPIRNELGVPIVITSGFRPPWLNKIIKGARDSYHMYGCAADFETPTMPLTKAFDIIRGMNLPIDQLILEDPPNGWLHLGIALPGSAPRRQFLVAHRQADGSMKYEEVN